MINGVHWDRPWSEADTPPGDAAIMERYVLQPIRCRCVCGVAMIAEPTDAGIRLAVDAHQRNPRHRKWFRASGWANA